MDGSHEHSYIDANEAVTDTTTWQLKSGWETYPRGEPFWVEGGGTGPVGTEQGEGELQGTETIAEDNSIYGSWDAHVTPR